MEEGDRGDGERGGGGGVGRGGAGGGEGDQDGECRGLCVYKKIWELFKLITLTTNLKRVFFKKKKIGGRGRGNEEGTTIWGIEPSPTKWEFR